MPNGGAVVLTITNNDDQAGPPDGQEGRQRQRRDQDHAFGLASLAGTLVFDAGTRVVGSTKTYTAAALTVNAGSYTFDEINVDGYTEGTWTAPARRRATRPSTPAR